MRRVKVVEFPSFNLCSYTIAVKVEVVHRFYDRQDTTVIEIKNVMELNIIGSIT